MGMFLEKSRLSIHNLWFIVKKKTEIKAYRTCSVSNELNNQTILEFIRFQSIFFSFSLIVCVSCVVIIKTLRDRIIMTFWSGKVISHQSFCERSASYSFNQIQYRSIIQCWKKLHFFDWPNSKSKSNSTHSHSFKPYASMLNSHSALPFFNLWFVCNEIGKTILKATIERCAVHYRENSTDWSTILLFISSGIN